MRIKFGQHTTKVQQLAYKLSEEITMKHYRDGDLLPSINHLSAQYAVSRDTVFKAFLALKELGVIDSTPGKGYYVTSKITKVLLVLDEYTPFKEKLYNSFVKKLPYSYKVDILYHQYNEHLFNTIIRESLGQYNKYIVMNFNNEKFSSVLKKIPAPKLLLLDFGKFDKSKYSYISQDFDENFYAALSQLKDIVRSKYRKFVFLFPKRLKHPKSSIDFFRRFCDENELVCEILEDVDSITITKQTAYLAVKQQDVVRVVKQGRAEGLKCGRDYGLLAYNDIPSYEVIDDGITCLTIDWEKMGHEMSGFVLYNNQIQTVLPTEVRLRHSL